MSIIMETLCVPSTEERLIKVAGAAVSYIATLEGLIQDGDVTVRFSSEEVSDDIAEIAYKFRSAAIELVGEEVYNRIRDGEPLQR